MLVMYHSLERTEASHKQWLLLSTLMALQTVYSKLIVVQRLRWGFEQEVGVTPKTARDIQ